MKTISFTQTIQDDPVIPNGRVEVSFDADAELADVIRNFEAFLGAAGFHTPWVSLLDAYAFLPRRA